MNSFAEGQRVLVKQTEDGITLNAVGTVVRKKISEPSAWVELDKRSKNKAAHPFSDKQRERHVLAHPDDCEPATTNSAERRASRRAADRPEVTVDKFGRDHWSTLAYIETLCVDGDGSPHKERMRCIRDRHPAYANGQDSTNYPTRLRDGSLLSGHDDWDCADDLERAGFIEQIGTGTHPQFRMTKDGSRVVAELREFKQKGGSFSTFVPTQTGNGEGCIDPGGQVSESG